MNDTTFIDLIRHGEPQGGPMFRGSKDDPLSELGWEQMKGAVPEDETWDVVVTSPLRRCCEFAKQVAGERRIPLVTEPQLQEVHFGDWEGLTAAQIESAFGDHLQRFWANPVANTPGGGEALPAFYDRVGAGWRQLLDDQRGKRVLLVCHGGVIRMLLARVLGIPLEQSFSGFAVPYACRSRIRVDRSEHGEFSALLSHTPAVQD
ncbi:alpha-ribazole phosphatase family protein [Marinobacter sp. JSM 1782161]|uniref:histidine phosphatase family protein n=1 Tax=Marinobacter sp. JSM 1782161 TaxID=2685906 RepID=UPI002B1BD0AA|nr:alpha-ribazole phosphatase family protein [Marinobacter sp. JSM 1782161]